VLGAAGAGAWWCAAADVCSSAALLEELSLSLLVAAQLHSSCPLSTSLLARSPCCVSPFRLVVAVCWSALVVASLCLLVAALCLLVA